MAHVFIIHGWGASPEKEWYRWLAMKLEQRGFTVTVPRMPNPERPSINEWTAKLSEVAGSEAKPYFVGHSIGCQTILRYIERSGKPASGVLLVAPWLHLKEAAYETEQDKETAREWLSTPIDFKAVRKRMGSCRVIMARDDPFVPVEDSEIFRKELGASINIMPVKSHFTAEDGYSELHAALNEFMKMAAPAQKQGGAN
jgi:predicted alpha/beta hydrolase family esterase